MNMEGRKVESYKIPIKLEWLVLVFIVENNTYKNDKGIIKDLILERINDFFIVWSHRKKEATWSGKQLIIKMFRVHYKIWGKDI